MLILFPYYHIPAFFRLYYTPVLLLIVCPLPPLLYISRPVPLSINYNDISLSYPVFLWRLADAGCFPSLICISSNVPFSY